MRTWRLPEIQRFTLASGLTVWQLERQDLPIYSLTFVFPRGAIEDPPGLPGTAHLAGATLDTGTTTRTALDIAGSLEHLGSSYHLHTGHDGTTIGIVSLVRNLRPTLTIVGDILAHPTFPDEEVERKRTQHVTSLAQQKDRPSTLASWAFHRLAYGASHPYGTDAGGTERSVGEISRAAIVAYHSENRTPDSCTAIAIGPTTDSELRELLNDALASWDLRRPNNAASPPPPAVPKEGIFLIDRPGSAQAEIRTGQPSLARNSPDFFPVIVLNRILGGQFSSRLNANLRERRGFTYGAWSSFGLGRLGGPFIAGAATNTGDTGAAAQEILREIEGIAGGNVTAEELAFAIEGIAGGFGLLFETPPQVAGVLQNIILYDLGDDYYSAYLDHLRGVTLDSVNAAAGRYLSPRTMTTVIVGDAGTILPRMSGIGEVTATRPDDLGI